ncbi:MAG: FAD-dependent oxidoreductase, partial [Spirochaetia bacterium]|nr:FAD-dependent oxidoreductase [Spirochaetia bacterium]
MSNLHYYNPAWIQKKEQVVEADLCVYSGSSAGVIAAVKARKLGHSVVLCHPGLHLGGLSSGGLGYTDFGNQAVIGGLSRDFYKRVGKHYDKPEVWKFEPGVAEKVFLALVKEFDIPVYFSSYLKEVDMKGKKITQAVFEGGLRVKAKYFVDASYEGDLMAKAAVSWTVGREGNAMYGETCNGYQIHTTHQFDHPVDPYLIPGKPESGLLPGIRGEDAGPDGRGDKLLQAYNFRMCMTDEASNRIPFPKPAKYDAKEYILCARWLESIVKHGVSKDGGFTNGNIFQKFDRVT